MEIPFVDLKAQYQVLKQEIDERIRNTLSHAMFILGPEVEESEAALSAYTGAKHTVTCASGTDALLMALLALGVGPGDEVITTCFSWISTAEVMPLVGAKPVFVDIEPDTYNIDVSKIKAVLSPRTKAIIPVSLFGQPADMDEINALAAEHGIAVIEDAAQSFGATYKGRKSCHLSSVGCTSFFPAKPLGCYGDGGAVFTDDDDLASVLRSIRVHGQAERCEHPRVGINGRMDTLQCAILLAKLKRFPWEIGERQRIAKRYDEAFGAFSDVMITPVIRSDRTSAYAQYTLLVKEREKFRSLLKDKGVPTAVYYPIPMHLQPAYRTGETPCLPEAEKAAQGVVSIPMYADLGEERIAFIIEAVLDAARSIRA